jgi:hypothetical protein
MYYIFILPIHSKNNIKSSKSFIEYYEMINDNLIINSHQVYF